MHSRARPAERYTMQPAVIMIIAIAIAITIVLALKAGKRNDND